MDHTLPADTCHLALLRGINVGGKNIIAKDDLRGCFEDAGYRRVQTYIQSGNILFDAAGESIEEITRRIETALAERFDYEAQAVVIARRRYRQMVAAAPCEWGQADDWKHNAMFLLGGLRGRQVLQELPEPVEPIERVHVVPGALFWSVAKEGLTRSTLMKLAKSKVYQQMTVRNHNTVNKLLAMMAERD